MEKISIVILFLGIILTLFKDYWLLGIVLMLAGFALVGRNMDDQ